MVRIKKILFVIFALLLSDCYAMQNDSCKASEGFSGIVRVASPAVVNISTEYKVKASNGANDILQGIPDHFREFFEKLDPFFSHKQVERNVKSLGSGFIIDQSGVIVTNNHVIANASQIKVTLNSGDQHTAKVLGKDERTDLAVLKIDTKKKLPYIEFVSNDCSRVGDLVVAIGNPFGLGGSVSSGIISAIGRDINISSSDGGFIQTDAAINSGNSGGPLFNMDGKVIGVNTAIYSSSGGGSIGIGFAIPSDVAMKVVNLLARGENIKRGWIGVYIQEITSDMQDSLKDINNSLDGVKGVFVAGIESGSPASKSGIKERDIIVGINGSVVTNYKKLAGIISSTKVGDTIILAILRPGSKTNKELKISVKVDGYKDGDKKENKSVEILGLLVSDLNNILRKQYNIDDNTEGVLVLENKEMMNSILGKGDVIIGVGLDQRIKSVSNLQSIIENAKKAGQKSLLLSIKKRGIDHSIFTGVTIE